MQRRLGQATAKARRGCTDTQSRDKRGQVSIARKTCAAAAGRFKARSTRPALFGPPAALSELRRFWVAPIAGALIGAVIYRALPSNGNGNGNGNED
jgi:hypothetical protein